MVLVHLPVSLPAILMSAVPTQQLVLNQHCTDVDPFQVRL